MPRRDRRLRPKTGDFHFGTFGEYSSGRDTCCLYAQTYYIWSTMQTSTTGNEGKKTCQINSDATLVGVCAKRIGTVGTTARVSGP